jgi:XTP/dITP diphosphohydrolase
MPAVEETGETFEENALLKARAAAGASGLVTLAEDSGLEVDALGGRPGVRSARYAGEEAPPAQKIAALLAELDKVEEERQRAGGARGVEAASDAIARSARFRCVMVLIDPASGAEHVAEGRCEGWIARSPRGSGGFGYDPVFVVRGSGAGVSSTGGEREGNRTERTMAELTEAEKNVISHRARAFAAIVPHLKALYG